MSSESRLMKAFELTAFSRQLFLHGLRRRFPDLTEGELHELYLERLVKCHSRTLKLGVESEMERLRNEAMTG